MKTYKANGVTFTVIPGEKLAKKNLRAAIPDLYSRLLSSLSMRAPTRPHVAEDALHDVLLQELEQERPSIRNLKAFLKTAALRKFRRSLKLEGRFVPLGQFPEEDAQKIEDKNPRNPAAAAEVARKRESARGAWDQLEYLPLRQRYVLTRWCQGFSIGEIADQLDLSPENVRFHKHAALQSVRDRLGIRAEETA